MERARKNFGREPAARDAEYEPLTATDDDHAMLEDSTILEPPSETPFSWIEYTIFVLLGVAMLWAWYEDLSPPSAPHQPHLEAMHHDPTFC